MINGNLQWLFFQAGFVSRVLPKIIWEIPARDTLWVLETETVWTLEEEC